MSKELIKLYKAMLSHSTLFDVKTVEEKNGEIHIYLEHVGTYWPQIEPISVTGQKGIHIKLTPNV